MSKGSWKGMAVLFCVVFAAVVLTGCGDRSQTSAVESASISQLMPTAEPTPVPFYGLSVEEITEEGDMVALSTTYGELRYPFAFSDLIRVEAENTQSSAALKFFAEISGAEYPLFTLSFHGEEGAVIGSMPIPDAGEPVPVCVEIYGLEAELDESDQITFYAVQETVNDVLASLMEIEGFVPAK